MNKNGHPVGMVSSANAGRASVIGIRQVINLKKLSGEKKLESSRITGEAYRQCQQAILQGERETKQLTQVFLADLKSSCTNTNNTRFMRRAAQLLSGVGQYSDSENLLKSVLAIDPNDIDARLDLVEQYVTMRRYNEALSIIPQLINVVPDDTRLQSFALQTGRFTSNKKLTDDAISLIKRYNPEFLEDANNFLNSDPIPSMRGSFN